MRKHLFISTLMIVLCALFSFSSYAAKISGTVTDEKNEPLAGVTVIIKSLEKGTQTDADGKYEIDNVEDGTYEVLFTLMTFKKSLQTVTVSKGADVVADTKLKEEGRNLTEVVVKSAKLSSTENAVIMEMRKSNSMVSAISAQQISKTMDRNAADVVKRIPGVTIMDDKFIMVRGLNDRYNTVWLNDATAPSSEVDKRAFSFDLIPAGQIDRIVIAKTPAPELPGDFAGGMVKVYTTSIPDKNTYSLGFQGSSREFTTGTKFNYNPRSSTDWLGFDDGMRKLPDAVPQMDKFDPEKKLSNNDDNIDEVTKAFKNNWVVKNKNASPDMRLNFSASNVFKLGKKMRLGNTFAANYSNVNTNYIIYRNDWESVDLLLRQREKASVNNVSSVLMDNVALAWGNNRVEFKNLLNQIGRSSLIDRYSIPDVAKEEATMHDYSMGYESRRIYTTQLTGNHKSSDDSRKYTWTLGYSDLKKDMPDLKRIRYKKNFEQEDSMYAVPIKPGASDPNYSGGRIFSKLNEKVYSFNQQFSQKIRIKNYEFEASIGSFIEFKERSYALRQFGYTLNNRVNNKSNPNYFTFPRLGINTIFDDTHVGSAVNFRLNEETNDFDSYDAKNKLYAGYLALKLPAGPRFTAYGGVRYEYNEYTLSAIANLQPVNPVITTKFLLPSLNLSYNLTDKQIVRVAYGKTLNRPEFRENAPFFFYDLETRWGVYGSMMRTLINPVGDTLAVAQIHNIDARWEWYPSSSEVIQAGVFYKHLKDPIQQVINDPAGDTRAYTFANLKEGYSYGLELDVRKNLSFFDDWFKTGFFKSLSLVGNLALIRSEVTPDSNIKVKKNIPLQGQSPYMYNAGLYYQNDSIGLQVSALYNVFGPRIFALGAPNDDDRVGNIWEMPFQGLDIIASKKLFKYMTISFGVQNLLDQKVRMVQDADYDNVIKGNVEDLRNPTDKLISLYKPGRYYTFGIKFKL